MEQDVTERAREKALRLLATRERSRREIEQKLLASGFVSSTVALVTDWLLERGYLDDRRFAVHYLEEKRRSGWSTRRIRSELIRRGVRREEVDEVLAAETAVCGDSAGELDVALTLVRRRFGQEFASDPQTATRRVAGFLARRGFDWEDISRVLQLLAEEAHGRGSPEGLS